MKIEKIVLLTLVLFAMILSGESLKNNKLEETNFIVSQTSAQEHKNPAEEYEDDMPPSA